MSYSKKTSLIILGVTSLIFSRLLFALFNDPEGPNLLVVLVMAIILYVLSSLIYVYAPLAKQNDKKNLVFLIIVQIIIVGGFYFVLK